MSSLDCPQGSVAAWAHAMMSGVGGLLIRSSGREAMRRAAPFYLGLLMVAFILFAGNGLNASTVTAAAERSPPLRVALLAVWIAATMPATRALLHDRRVQFLKSLPVGERHILLILAALLCVGELPWIFLWARGAGLLATCNATFVGLALRTLWLARPWSTLRSALAAFLFAAWSTPKMPRLALLAASFALFLSALRWAWRRSPDEAAARSSWWVGGPAVVALASAHLVTLLRASSAIVVRSVALASVAAAFSYLLVRNNESHPWLMELQRLEAVYVPAGVLIMVSLGGPILRTERAAAWLLDANAVLLLSRRRALALALALANAAVATVYAIALGLALRLTSACIFQLWSELTAMAVAFAVMGGGALRSAVKDEGRDGARLILLTVGGVGAAECALAIAPRVGPAGWLATTALWLIAEPWRCARRARSASSGGAVA